MLVSPEIVNLLSLNEGKVVKREFRLVMVSYYPSETAIARLRDSPLEGALAYEARINGTQAPLLRVGVIGEFRVYFTENQVGGVLDISDIGWSVPRIQFVELPFRALAPYQHKVLSVTPQSYLPILHFTSTDLEGSMWHEHYRNN